MRDIVGGILAPFTYQSQIGASFLFITLSPIWLHTTRPCTSDHGQVGLGEVCTSALTEQTGGGCSGSSCRGGGGSSRSSCRGGGRGGGGGRRSSSSISSSS